MMAGKKMLDEEELFHVRPEMEGLEDRVKTSAFKEIKKKPGEESYSYSFNLDHHDLVC
ncbi:MAG: hypothetical protein KBI12_05000 [Methanothrix sp.]|nr:hypothetical protein [Methanothrix sp.]HRT16804.1 hypothetical protein [Methanothrix sp.]